MAVTSSVALAWIRHVPQDFPTIQAGIDACFEGDTVLVAPGTYTECLDFGGSNITVGSLLITTGDTSYVSSTILDGNSAGTLISFLTGEDGTAVLAGFTITEGRSTNGGAIKCVDASPTIRNNKFLINTVPSAGRGGAILCDSSASPLIKDNDFRNNQASYGGAIACLHDSHPRIEGNHFQSNSVTSDGGAIYVNDSYPVVRNNTLTLNSASRGGAIMFWNHADGQIVANHIFQNSSSSGGGGIYCYASNCVIDSNIVTDNTAGLDGGGIAVHSANPTISGNFIRGNFSEYFGGGVNLTESNVIVKNNTIRRNLSGQGGGIASWSHCVLHAEGNVIDSNTVSLKGGGLLVEPSISTLERNLIAYNSSSNYGGGICFQGNSTAARNIIIGNSAPQGGAISSNWGGVQDLIGNVISGNSGYYTGGIHCVAGSQMILSNCILWEDSSTIYGEVYVGDSSTVSISYSDVTGGFPGTGNIDVDPLFRDPMAHDYRLMSVACGDSADSPCIDVGDPGLIDSLLTCDWGLGTLLCDMGAYGGALTAGRTLHVPADYYYIQDAIIASHDRDTILVQPGVYYERINYLDKKIIIGSVLMLTGDTAYISSTIIDGDSAGVVVRFTNGQDSTAALIGFTIRNGYSVSNGGGIYCRYSSPTIYSNIIRDNLTVYRGGGIFTDYGAHPKITTNVITHNRTISQYAAGGGVYCEDLPSRFANNVIAWNTALGPGARGGGIYLFASGSTLLNNVVANNAADSIGGGVYFWRSADVRNIIVWANEASAGPQIYARQESLITITFSDIQGGWEGEGNIEIEPLFRDPAAANYRLQAVACGWSQDSPCIDVGDPLLEDSQLDCEHGLGDSRSDMGAYGGITPVSVSVEDGIVLPVKTILLQNYPNPFNDATVMPFMLERGGNTEIEIYDILGRRVRTLELGHLGAGSHSITWEAGNLSSGVYFYVLETAGSRTVRKCLLLK